MSWAVSVAHEDGRVLNLIELDELPSEGGVIDVPTLLPPNPSPELLEFLPETLPYEVLRIEATYETETATITVREKRIEGMTGGMRQIGV